MFNLSYKIKDEMEIDDKVYKVNLTFDNVLRFYDMMADGDLSDIEKVIIALQMFLGDSVTDNVEIQVKIFNEIIEEFLKDGHSSVRLDRAGNPLPMKKEKKVYDFKHDAEYIYASFVQAYGVDLIEQQGSLHWLKFKALLNALPEDTKFRQVIDIRTRELPKGKHAAEERKALTKLKKDYALPKE